VVANFATEKPHHGCAQQWFREDGILAYLPLPGERMSMVWSTWDEAADAIAALPAEELAARVAEAGRHALGALRVITPAQAFPLRLLNVGSLVKPRLALVGDAAHNVHPLAGYGVNLGFEDAKTLAQVLAARAPETDCGSYSLLRRYDRARQEAIVAMQLTTDALQKLFNNPNPALRLARNAGLAFTDRLGWLKNRLVRHALGSESSAFSGAANQ
jgi:ubiquinone biosynthesis UbiH/UbiF/VisC/COQ6 family hydroxylase